MTLLTQVVLLHWKDGDEEHKQELWNIQLDGSGRLKWAAVKEAFGADLVEIEDEGTPALLEDGEQKGFTTQGLAGLDAMELCRSLPPWKAAWTCVRAEQCGVARTWFWHGPELEYI